MDLVCDDTNGIGFVNIKEYNIVGDMLYIKSSGYNSNGALDGYYQYKCGMRMYIDGYILAFTKEILHIVGTYAAIKMHNPTYTRL